MYAVLIAQRIARVISVKTRRGAGHAGQPGGSRGAGVLHQFGVRRMLKRLLALAIVIETEFIHRAVVDCPGVGNVPLLEALRHNVAEAGEIGASQLEAGKRAFCGVVVEIVIDAQVLLVIQPVVKSECNLVAADGLDRHSADERTAIRRSRDKLEKINRSRVQASEGNDIVLSTRHVGKNTGSHKLPARIVSTGIRNSVIEAKP